MHIETLYTLIDEFLKILVHKEEKNRKLSDAEVIFVYIMSFESFGGNYSKALNYLVQGNHIKYKLSKSRFSRRLYKIKDIIEQIFEILSCFAKNNCSIYQLDSFPVKVCHNIRIQRANILKGKEFRGYNSSKKEYFYGFKVQVITSDSGYIIEFNFCPGSYHDMSAFDILDFNLPENSELLTDKAYNDYNLEEILLEHHKIRLLPIRKRILRKKIIIFVLITIDKQKDILLKIFLV
ncbi:MAG: IS982 family transposase [Candidatus Sericytochromatia bacterium]